MFAIDLGLLEKEVTPKLQMWCNKLAGRLVSLPPVGGGHVVEEFPSIFLDFRIQLERVQQR